MTLNFDPHVKYSLPQMGSWQPAVHVFGKETEESTEQEQQDYRSVWAIRAALASGRPLLVRGQPGTGKSQLARAAAVALKRAFIYTVITSRTESQDLLWRFDAVGRLAWAQERAHCGDNCEEQKLQARHFVQPGPMWWALDWASAKTQNADPCKIPSEEPWRPDAPESNDKNAPQGPPENGVVLLIDEIDKADVDVPNGLLECLANRGFKVPHGIEDINAVKGPPPLIIITTNEERELPWAFVRRCLVHTLQLPAKRDTLIQWLVSRGREHSPKVPKVILERAAAFLADDRAEAKTLETVQPGQAEYLDMVRAVDGMIFSNKDNKASVKDKLSQGEALLEKIKDFSLKKKLLEEFE